MHNTCEVLMLSGHATLLFFENNNQDILIILGFFSKSVVEFSTIQKSRSFKFFARLKDDQT